MILARLRRLQRHQNKINLQRLHPTQQLQFTLNGPAFRLTQQFHRMGSFPLLLLQIHRLIPTCGELSPWCHLTGQHHHLT
uniref:Uncharacterized protein n=1 Tax=Arundo donax TaxID=35708 RepID=A0A0A9EW57_ARUDO